MGFKGTSSFAHGLTSLGINLFVLRDPNPRALYLPNGYRLDEATYPGTPQLKRPDDSIVATFGTTGTSREEIEKATWEDARVRERRP